MVAIEADGYRHHSGKVAWQRDRVRRNALTIRVWRVLHVTWEDHEARPYEVVAEIRGALVKKPIRQSGELPSSEGTRGVGSPSEWL
jgi:very-short-patch-repair endonuclease